jgi:hypothetical protein
LSGPKLKVGETPGVVGDVGHCFDESPAVQVLAGRLGRSGEEIDLLAPPLDWALFFNEVGLVALGIFWIRLVPNVPTASVAGVVAAQ